MDLVLSLTAVVAATTCFALRLGAAAPPTVKPCPLRSFSCRPNGKAGGTGTQMLRGPE